jgi:hypothetical protein
MNVKIANIGRRPNVSETGAKTRGPIPYCTNIPHPSAIRDSFSRQAGPMRVGIKGRRT